MKDYISKSEASGLSYLKSTDLKVLSVGISTGGAAEINMAKQSSPRHIIATTIDEKGLEITSSKVEELGLSNQISLKIEDISEPLTYKENYFDYIYARLVLHYLNREKLNSTLISLHRVAKKNARLFVVVRSDQSPEAQQEDNIYDTESGLTTYKTADGKKLTRYFHSVASISSAIENAGWEIINKEQYDEKLNAAFDRKGFWVENNVIEILAIKV